MSVRRRVQILALGCLLVLGAGCGGSGHHRAQAQQPFSYDPAQSLRFVDRGRVNRPYPIAIHDVSYTAGKDRIPAYLLLPPSTGKRRPAVVYLHDTTGNRGTLVVPAAWLAGRGAVALAITAPSATNSAPTSGSALDRLRGQVRLEERDVIAVRRAIDLLRRRHDVDPNRIGFVGWSAGARTGAILAGIEPRLRTLVLMSGGSTPISSYVNRAPASLRPTLTRYLTSVDPLAYIGMARGSSLLLQDGRRDEVVPRSALNALARAAPEGTTVRWYDAGHVLSPKAYRDQLAWLASKLDLTGPPVKGALTGPK